LALFATGVGVALVNTLSVLEYILAIFVPSSSAYVTGIELVRKHLDVANEKLSIEDYVQHRWETALADPGTLSVAECRHIQDRIYGLRKTGPLVPDKWYTWLRDHYEVDMRTAVADMKKQADKASTPNP
jgi:hypothetical protein